MLILKKSITKNLINNKGFLKVFFLWYNITNKEGDTMKEKVLIIIPAYNEEMSVLKTYSEIVNYNKEHKTKYDVIVINDGSKDGTEKVLKDNDIPHIRLIQNLGIGGAVQTGYKYALKHGYDIAVQFDGDGQHDVNYIETIIRPIIEGKANMVIGSRFIQKDFSDFKSSLVPAYGSTFS